MDDVPGFEFFNRYMSAGLANFYDAYHLLPREWIRPGVVASTIRLAREIHEGQFRRSGAEVITGHILPVAIFSYENAFRLGSIGFRGIVPELTACKGLVHDFGEDGELKEMNRYRTRLAIQFGADFLSQVGLLNIVHRDAVNKMPDHVKTARMLYNLRFMDIDTIGIKGIDIYCNNDGSPIRPGKYNQRRRVLEVIGRAYPVLAALARVRLERSPILQEPFSTVRRNEVEVGVA